MEPFHLKQKITKINNIKNKNNQLKKYLIDFYFKIFFPFLVQ